MTTPVWIQTTTLSEQDAAVMIAWAEAMQAIEKSGRSPHIGDAVSLMRKLIEEHFPRLKGWRQTEMLGKLFREQARGQLLVQGPGGSA